MNTINLSSSSSRKTSSAEYSDSGFYKAPRDKSLYVRLITPPGLNALLIAVIGALLNGLWIFAKGEGTSTAVDLATSYALIVLFSLVFGAWLGVAFEVIFRKLVYRAIDDLERRIDKLLGGTIDCNTEDHDTAQAINGRQVDYKGVFYFLLYLWSFPILGFYLMLSILQRYAYADSSPAVSELISPNVSIAFALLCSSIAACAFLMCWVWARVIRLRHRIGVLEKKSDPATLATDIRTLASPNMSAIDYIARAHRQTVRFVTGVF